MDLDDFEAEQRLLKLKQQARFSAEQEAALKSVCRAKGERSANAANDERFDRRQSPRRQVRGAEVAMRRIGGFNFQVALGDVSAGGCSVELIEECEAGEHVIARFPQLEPLGGSVRWTAGTSVGIAFNRSIHPAVLDALIGRLSGIEPQAA